MLIRWISNDNVFRYGFCIVLFACYNLRMIYKAKFFVLFIVVTSLLVGLRTASAQVKVWEDTMSLPTYEEGLPDTNPPFDQFSSNSNYPYTVRDQLTNQRVDHKWRAVYLENEYVKCSVLPDLGGHVYTCMDKISNQSMFYANPSIKKADIGYRGGWSAFGVEFNFPVSHNWVTASPVDYSYRSNADGSASVFVGNIDRVYGMQWTVEVVLRPKATVVEMKVALSNRSDVRHRFYWWSNAGVQVWDDSKVSYPQQFTASHGFTEVNTWPVDMNGTDLSMLKNQKFGPVSKFTYGSREPFMGIWHPKTNTGIVHYSEYEELSGKKFWSWGSDPDGMDWRKTLSDNDSAYMEIQAGLFRNQETYAFLQPRQTIHFTEYWLPVRDLGGITRVNLNGALNMTREGTALKVAFNANHAVPDATVRILLAGNAVFSEKASLMPETTWKHTLDSADGAKKYTFEVVDASGAVVMHHTEGVYDWTPASEVQVGQKMAYQMPEANKRTEDDWIQLGQDDELNGARLAALDNYKLALEKFPASVSLQKAAGRLSADLLRYDEAVKYLEPVEKRQTWNSETVYYLGIAYDGLGRTREAKIAFESARRLPEFHAAGTVRLAELEAREGQLQAAANDLADALRGTPDDIRTAEELVAVKQALGQKDAAHALASEWLARFPTSYILREELGEPDNAHLGADVDRVLNTAQQYMRLGLYQAAYGVLSRKYPAVPADQREPAEVAPQDNPLVAYYRGYCRMKLGQSPEDDYAAGARLSTQYIFPSGALTYEVLKSVALMMPKDANAVYLLGNQQFSVGLADEGLDKWQRALALNAKIPALDASIGRALLHIKGNTAGALAAFERGVTSDPHNLDNYFGVDQAMSLLKKSATERVAALSRYPDGKKMPTDLVYELALNLTEAGEYDRAVQLFSNRYFARAEGGTNVRQVWLEVHTQQALALAHAGHCDEALKIIGQLGAPVAGLEFTKDGLQPILDTSRSNYLVGDIYAACKQEDKARDRYEQAASVTDSDQIAWAYRAVMNMGKFDEAKWRGRLTASLTTNRWYGSYGAYLTAMAQRELGNEAAADASFKNALLQPDSQMAYHLTRLALAQSGK